MEGVTFDLEYPMMLPLSLPSTPFDLEADIAQGLEKLRSSHGPDAVTKPKSDQQRQQQPPPPPEIVVQPQLQLPQVFDDVFSPFSPTLIPHPDSPTTTESNNNMEEKVLKSRWSTSTLSSIREEHETRGGGGASAKFRLYFSGHSPLKSKHPKPTKISSSRPPSSSPSHKAYPSSCSPSPAISCTNSSRSLNNKSSPRTRSRYSDVMVIGYGGTTTSGGIRRRGSVTNSVSDAGSEESCSSTSSSGLRRKPIPVEMFLRSGGLISP